MASILNSIEEHPEYLFDHLICIKLKKSKTCFDETARCVAIDQFTNQIYVYIYESPSIRIGAVLIYSQCGEFLRSFSLADMEDYAQYVHCMAIHRNNVYIVSRFSCILHFKEADSMTLISCMNAKGPGIGEFEEPRQLDISSEGDLFVADFRNNRVQILDGNLQYKRHISHHSMLKPCDVKLTPDEVYVLGYSLLQSNFCIHMFTHMGEKLSSVFLNGIPKGMENPGFCVDTCGNVIIIDNGTQQIKFFTKEGNLFETMDILGRLSNMSIELMGVAWMNIHKLVVISGDYYQYYCLEMYS